MRTLLLILSDIYLKSKVKRLVIILTDIFIVQREYLKDIIPMAIFMMIITIL